MSKVAVRKRNNSNHFEFRFEIANVNGIRKWCSKGGYKTKKEAYDAGIKAYNDYFNKGIPVSTKKISYSDFLDIWLKKDCEIDLKDTTVYNYQKRVNTLIKPQLGHYYLDSIENSDIQDFINYLFDNGYSFNSISSIRGIITKSFGYAIKNKYIKHNPSTDIKLPKNKVPTVDTRKHDGRNLSDEEIKKIFSLIDKNNSDYIPMMMAYKCGLRLGEAFAICWEDIDFYNKTLTINQQMQWEQDLSKSLSNKKEYNGKKESGNGYWYFTNPKYNSKRTIDLSDDIIEMLREEKEKQNKNKEKYQEFYLKLYKETNNTIKSKLTSVESNYEVHLLCVRENGEFITPRTMQHASSIIHKEIKDFKFHDLRHTHATKLYEAGFNQKYISERLGHKDIKITIDTYEHLTDKIKMKNKIRLNELL